MGKSSFGGLSRYACPSALGNVGVWTSLHRRAQTCAAGRAVRAHGAAEGDQGVEAAVRSAAGLFRAGWPGSRHWQLAMLCLPLRGPSGVAAGTRRPQLKLLRAPARGAAAAPTSTMPPVTTLLRCAQCPSHSPAFGAGPLQPSAACPRASCFTDPQPATPYPRRIGYDWAAGRFWRQRHKLHLERGCPTRHGGACERRVKGLRFL
jgi:hypothetical protein